MREKATLSEMSSALAELGFTSQEMANTELLAHDLTRHGFTPASAEVAVIRMRRRAEVLDEARVLLAGASGPFEALVRELAHTEPPRWGVIWRLTGCLVAARVQRLRRRKLRDH